VTLQAGGVRLVGRFEGMEGTRALFRADLAEHVAAADVALHRLLDDVDEHIALCGLSAEVLPADRPRRLDVPSPTRFLDLAHERICTVVVATGYRPDYPWLRLPIIATDGSIRQDRGVTAAPGVYVVGQRFQHRRDSAFIGGARHDARAVVRHLLRGSTVDAPDGFSEEPAA
jgi:putative flavoprotein involved in K+ transport